MIKKYQTYFFLSFFIFLPLIEAAETKLEFSYLMLSPDAGEISGLAIKQDKLYFVLDKPHQSFIYSVLPNPKKKSFIYQPAIDLKTLSGFKEYMQSIASAQHAGQKIENLLDLEGLSFCDDQFYVVNERLRHIVRLDGKKITNIAWDTRSFFKKQGFDLDKIPENAGLEGVALDCKRNIAYLAQERSPAGIIRLNLKDTSEIEWLNIDFKSLTKEDIDISGLFFEAQSLFILLRGAHQIAEYDTLQGKLTHIYSFRFLEDFDFKQMYDTGEPYGLAESLAMDKKNIYIGIDNNTSPLSDKAKNQFGIKGNNSMILVFKR